MRPPAEPAPFDSLAPLALAALVASAVLLPWAVGGVQPPARLALVATALLASALVLLDGAIRGRLTLPDVPAWPVASFLVLALLQLLPLPAALHRLLAPGSHAAWHPADPLVAEVLGRSARPISLDPDTTLAAIALTGGLCLLALLAAPVLARPTAAVAALAAVAVSGSAMSAYAIWARGRFGSLLYGQYSVPTTAPFGPFVSKNHFAGWTVMAALLVAGLALGLADGARRRGRDWTADPRAGGVILAVVAALVMALAALVSLSRGGGMALAAGVSCLLALRLFGARSRATLVATLAPALVLGAILVALVPQEAHERMRSLSGASFRLDTWRDTLRLAAASPVVGHGLGAFHDAYPPFKRGHGIVRVEHAENDYLETLAETGAVGLLLVLAGVALVLARGLRGADASSSALARAVAQGGCAALVALAVHSLVDFNLRIPSNAALAALAAAAVAAGAGRSARALPRVAAAALAALVLALAAAGARLPDEPWLRARAEVQAASAATLPAVRRLRLERAQAALQAELRRRPADAESWLLLAYCERALGHADRAAACARHALALDPERPGLREAAAQLSPPAP